MIKRDLPFNRPFFRGIDLGDLWCVTEQITFDVVEEKGLGVRIGQVQAVMINDLCLFLQPAAPARLADFCRDALAELIWKRCERESRPLLAAMCAFDCVRHVDLLVFAPRE